MIYRNKNIIFSLILIVLIFLIIASTALFVLMLVLDWEEFFAIPRISHIWWFMYEDYTPVYTDYIWNTGILLSSLILLLISFLILKNIHNRTGLPEILFFIFFIMTISFECLRPFLLLTNIFNLPVYVSILISRIIYFLRFFGLFLLLFTSLYILEIKYHKYGVLLIITALLSITFAYVLPIDSSVLLTNHLYKIGNEISFSFTSIAIQIVCLINLIIAYLRKKQKRIIYLTIAVFLVILGRELLIFNILNILNFAGFVFLFCGLIILFKNIGKVYLWT